MIKLYAFLGNYGREYAGNRHNVAWLFLDSLALSSSLTWKHGFKGLWAQTETPAGRAWFVKPETYMNASGDSVAELARFHKIAPEEILVVHDELEMGFGFYGFKKGGGLGGHNGLRSMKARFGTPDFMRLRFGIGRPDHDDIAGYVLTDFGRDEREKLACSIFPAAGKALSLCMDKGFDEALGLFPKVNALA